MADGKDIDPGRQTSLSSTSRRQTVRLTTCQQRPSLSSTSWKRTANDFAVRHPRPADGKDNGRQCGGVSAVRGLTALFAVCQRAVKSQSSLPSADRRQRAQLGSTGQLPRGQLCPPPADGKVIWIFAVRTAKWPNRQPVFPGFKGSCHVSSLPSASRRQRGYISPVFVWIHLIS